MLPTTRLVGALQIPLGEGNRTVVLCLPIRMHGKTPAVVSARSGMHSNTTPAPCHWPSSRIADPCCSALVTLQTKHDVSGQGTHSNTGQQPASPLLL